MFIYKMLYLLTTVEIWVKMFTWFFTAYSLRARRVRETPRRFACSFANCSTTELLWNIGYNDALAFLLLVVCWLVVSKRLLADFHVHLQIALPLSYCGMLFVMMH